MTEKQKLFPYRCGLSQQGMQRQLAVAEKMQWDIMQAAAKVGAVIIHDSIVLTREQAEQMHQELAACYPWLQEWSDAIKKKVPRPHTAKTTKPQRPEGKTGSPKTAKQGAPAGKRLRP